MFVSSLYQQKKVKNYQNLLARYMKVRCIGISIKQMQQMSRDILSNQAL